MSPAGQMGGGEVHLVEYIDATIEISHTRRQPDGWRALSASIRGNWRCSAISTTRDVGEQTATMHSSSYNPTGKAEKVAGGYKVSGRWSFSSSCDHCKAVNLGAVAGLVDLGDATTPDFRSFLLMRDQYRIEDNWHTAGLKGTGSKDIVVEDAFVPEYRTQSHLDYAMNLPLAGQELNDGPLYRLPWSVVFNMALAASVLGSAHGFVDTWIDLTRDRKLGHGLKAADDSLSQRRLAEAIWAIEVTVARMRADALDCGRWRRRAKRPR